MRFDSITRVSLDNLRPLLSLFSADLAIDLGTVNTRVYARDKGIVVNESSAVALDNRTGEVQAVGKEATEMLGRTPGNLRVVKPMKDGVIADFKVTEKMLNYFIQKAHQRRTLVHPHIVISVPSEITQVEKRAVTDAAYRAKAAEVHLVEQAMMAAIGAGLPVTKPGGNLVVDIGGGTTDVAVISMSGIVLRIRPELAPQAGKLIRNGRCRRCDLLGVMCHCNFLEKRSLITGGIFTGLSRKGPPPWRGVHEHADTSQKA